ncbi:hypothetical protein ACL02T_29880 [Pseudonocardia sp. RS010]|uniref:hypothetical protein n=1 Tax=Pseudonocardia sp. RS010 TaxID=3385979 RepID=UPI0039A2D04F
MTVIGLAQNYGTSGLRDWISSNVLSVVLLCIAVLLAAVAHKQEFGKAMGTVVIVVVGLAVAGIALNGDYAAIGRFFIGLVSQG